jgi:menaquinone-dependent protoporphyrinogen oxidase
MKRVALIVSSKTGHTAKIANGMAAIMRKNGVEADVFNLNYCYEPKAAELKSYDAVLIGAPVYLGEFPQVLLNWTWKNYAELQGVLTGLFTVGFNAADPRSKARAGDDRLLRKFIQLTGFSPMFVASFAGVLAYEHYSYFKKCVMQGMAALAGCPTDTNKDHELTNWDHVEQFMKAFQTEDLSSDFTAANRLQWMPDPVWPLGLQRVA